MQESEIGNITVEQLRLLQKSGESFLLLDVRGPDEAAICTLGGMLIPLDHLPQRLSELDPAQDIVVHCKLGGRSAKAAALLMQNGFKNVKNLEGGIIAWAQQIDPTMPQY